MSFSATIKESLLDDWVTTTRAKISPTLTDIVTPHHPIIDMLKEKGAVETEPPGQGPVRDVLYATPDRITHLSRSRDFQPSNRSPIAGITQAQYDWIMKVNTLVIGYWDYKNAADGKAMVKYVKRKMDQLETGLNNSIVNDIWNGRTVGNDHLFGLKDVIRFDPTANPSRGSVGRIGVANLPTWRNNAVRYNKPFRTFTDGAVTHSMLDDTTADQGASNNVGNQTLLDLYKECSNNKTEMGPDLMPCNMAFYKQFNALYRDGLVFPYKENQKINFGAQAFAYQNAAVYLDRDCPDDPNDADNGVCFMLNTDAFDLIYAEGIVKSWGEMYKENDPLSFLWDECTQYTMAYNDLRKLGVFFGSEPQV